MTKPGDRLTRALRIEELARPIRPFAAAPAFADQPYGCLLDQPGPATSLGRYAFLAAHPFHVIRSSRRTCDAGPPGALAAAPGEPLDVLRRLLFRHGAPVSSTAASLPPLLGGALGYLGYELLHLLEEIPDRRRDDHPVPDMYLVLYGTVVATDGLEQRSWVCSTGFGADAATAGHEAEARLRDALARLQELPRDDRDEVDRLMWRGQRERIVRDRPRLDAADLPRHGVRPVLDRDAYLELVAAAKRHIAAGDVYEVCTAQRFDARCTASGASLYAVLRAVNEAPFAAYLRFPELEVASSSPERYARLDHAGRVETRPIKGTRPRGTTPAEDEALRRDLGTSEKDRAENLMIVDLARNDLGRVCRLSSIEVPQLMAIESYPFAHQLVSTVTGRLRPELDAIDLVRASFPGGSMTGAPKIQAMKLIESLEPVDRGVFAGGIGYVDFGGAADFSIAIRTLVKRGDDVSFHVGGAIVADSDPAEEYQETLDKAHGLVTALELAHGRAAAEPEPTSTC